MAISVVFDFSEKIDDFMKSDPSVKEVLVNYYLNFVLHYANLFSPLLIFISLIFFVSKMAQRTEVTAILSGGVSFIRFLRPFLIAATILSMTALTMNHLIIPKANMVRMQFEEQYYKKTAIVKDSDIHLEVSPGVLAYFRKIDLDALKGEKFSLEKWDPKKGLTYKLISVSASQDTIEGVYRIQDYVERWFLDGEEKVSRGMQKDTVLNFDLSEFAEQTKLISTMNTFELNDFIDRERARGSDDLAFYEIEKHQRTSYPFATYVLTIIGVSVASRKVRGGIGVQIALAILIVLLYIFAMKVATVSATHAGLHPIIATWIPNMLFSVLAIILFRRALK